MRTVITFLLLALPTCVSAQDTPKLDAATRQKLRQAAVDLSAAMKAENEAAVNKVAKWSVELLGDQAGLPEAADEFRPVPKDARPLAPDELAAAFDPYVGYIGRQKWWTVDLDPAKTNHALREVATVIEGCLAARRAGAAKSDELLKIATDAGDFLVWAQERAGPACSRSRPCGRGRADRSRWPSGSTSR
jgi:cytochrome P450